VGDRHASVVSKGGEEQVLSFVLTEIDGERSSVGSKCSYYWSTQCAYLRWVICAFDTQVLGGCWNNHSLANGFVQILLNARAIHIWSNHKFDLAKVEVCMCTIPRKRAGKRKRQSAQRHPSTCILDVPNVILPMLSLLSRQTLYSTSKSEILHNSSPSAPRPGTAKEMSCSTREQIEPEHSECSQERHGATALTRALLPSPSPPSRRNDSEGKNKRRPSRKPYDRTATNPAQAPLSVKKSEVALRRKDPRVWAIEAFID
jgi:hypothetical protein